MQTPGASPIRGNGMAIASLALAILALIFFWASWLGIVLAALAVLFGIVGGRRARAGAPNQGVATAGLVIGIIALVLSVLVFISVNG